MRAHLATHGLFARGPGPQGGSRFLHQPATDRGRLSVWLTLTGVGVVVSAAALVAATELSVFGAFAALGLVVVIAGGFFALDAIVSGERSVFVVATLPLWLLAAFLLVGELAFEH